MHLTQWTDYALRVLMYCAAYEGREQPVTITEIAQAHGISRSHLTKIVRQLASLELLDTTRGRGGGMRLMRPAQEIIVGAVVRATETNFEMVECFSTSHSICRISSNCNLKGVLDRATRSYLAVLDGVTLADLAPQSARGMRRGAGAALVPGVPALA
ncbi:MAG: Rrf2 family transcriptional regulator [Comamonas sp. SCN 65-56]|uniref:RrF2 family transcriptional regulator n=1 Tax=Comamonas sp. SCN 65-56 TaxID=1660095 RepID=UPI0008693E84|nr:Rrf2 family transcriptional regulator [Comamonas sp. SCN 65-56]ODS92202.1 MAG: Rrf2 family transcriptional regulator [Comamonas sp. SCN 65-56]